MCYAEPAESIQRAWAKEAKAREREAVAKQSRLKRAQQMWVKLREAEIPSWKQLEGDGKATKPFTGTTASCLERAKPWNAADTPPKDAAVVTEQIWDMVARLSAQDAEVAALRAKKNKPGWMAELEVTSEVS